LKSFTPPRLGLAHRLIGALAFSALLSACASFEPTEIDSAPGPTNTPARVAPPATAAPAQPASAAAIKPSDAPLVLKAEPFDPLRPEEKVDLNAVVAETDLWARLRRGFAMPDINTPLVENREQWYASRPDYVQRMTTRGSRYLFHIVEEVERRGMPTELALLPFIESAFNPQAISSAKASGMWQFMPATGKYFDLRQNVFRDDRRDVLASTRAALDYLAKLYGMFGDWHLALAAYNWGEGSVQRAVARNRKAGLPTDYLSLRMPGETQYYVPKLQAVKNIVAQPKRFGITLPTLDNHPYFLSVPIQRDIDVAQAIELAGVTSEEFHTLNPQMNKPVILAAGTPQLLLPYNNASLFVRNIERHRGQLATWTAWVATKTLSPADAARLVGMSEEELRSVNKIPPHMLVTAGSTLLVPRSQYVHKDVSLALADNAVMSLTPEARNLRRMSLKAGRNDSVASIAKRYRVSAAQVAQWNKSSASMHFKKGQTIVVYVPAKSAKSSRGKGSHRAAASAKRTGGKSAHKNSHKASKGAAHSAARKKKRH
jgi:membrane-bound lytic murein transglycosylase D